MKKYILPFTLDVELKAYHNRAFPLGAMKGNISNYDLLICNKFINCRYREDGILETSEDYFWFSDDGVTKIQRMMMNSISYRNKGIDLIHLNKEMLREGAYVTGLYNEYYIKGKEAFQERDFLHDYIIFGYDDEKQVFKSAAYLTDKKYRYYDISYGDYYDSIVESKSDYLVIRYNTINKEYIPELNISTIRYQLENYYYSRDNMRDSYVACYGLKAWGMLKDYVKNIDENELDMRFGRVYMEHRKLMHMRINKLVEFNIIDDVNLRQVYYEKICEPSYKIYLLFMKYNITRNMKIKQHIVDLMDEINFNESELINRLIKQL